MIYNKPKGYNLVTLCNTLQPIIESPHMRAGRWVGLLEQPNGFRFAIPTQQTPGIIWQWNDYPAINMHNRPDHGEVVAYLEPECDTHKACRMAVIGYAQFALGLSDETIIHRLSNSDVWDARRLYTCSSAQAFDMLKPLRLFEKGRYVRGNTIVNSKPYIPQGVVTIA